jgi:ppGpp synthetase/RelA/SpoT-type nucleotidyltranferase
LREPSSLRQKLIGKASKDKKSGRKPTITKTNLFQRVSDLAGVRILHLYTDQIAEINKHILAVFKEQRYRVVEGPIANIWDDEAKAYFNKLGIKSRPRKTMYTSIHYVVELNTASRVRCELQVRTLAEELWGEVSHTVDYPTPTRSIACKEQLKVLARVASGCTRLVDSIFRSRDEFRSRRSGSGVKQGRSAKRGRS